MISRISDLLARLPQFLFALTTGIILSSGSFAGEVTVPAEFPVCFDFSCKSSAIVLLNQEDWLSVSDIFLPVETPRQERELLKDAIARMEQVVGQYTPTHRDVAKNLNDEQSDLAALSGQMDCIDESINTTTYLRTIEQAGLLRFHGVLERAYRKSILTQHWAAEVIEYDSGQRYVIDSWFKNNGETPLLVKSETWHDLSRF